MRVPEEIWKRTIWRICVMILFRLCFQNMLQSFLSTMKLCDFPVESMRLWNDYIKGSHFNRKGIKRMTWDMSHKNSTEARMEQIRFSKCIRKSSYKYSQKKKTKKKHQEFPFGFLLYFPFYETNAEDRKYHWSPWAALQINALQSKHYSLQQI